MLAVNPAGGGLDSWDVEIQPAIQACGGACVTAPANDRQSHCGIILEREWCEPPEDARGDAASPRIIVRRWKDDGSDLRQHSSGGIADFTIVAVTLRPTLARLTVNGRCLHDGKMPAGMTVLIAPGSRSAVEFSAACDIIHLFVPSGRLSEIVSETAGEPEPNPPESLCLSAPDAVIERLAWLLLKAKDHEGFSSEVYLDGIATAIVTRLFSYAKQSQSSRQGLVKWRLKRVQDFIEAELSESLSLRDLARCAGLSRMHFAAQFRAATGMRPHEYLVRQRIQRAQEILLTTSLPLVEVALSVGFQTQAHFTTVFRRLLGETPGRWRHAQRFG